MMQWAAQMAKMRDMMTKLIRKAEETFANEKEEKMQDATKMYNGPNSKSSTEKTIR